MSAITVLCFASLLYLSLADPVPSADQSDPQSSAMADVQAEMRSLYEDMEEIINNRLPTIMAPLNPDDQQYLMYTAEETLKSFLNYLLYLLYNGLDSKSAVSKPDDVIVTFLTTDDSYLSHNPDGYFITGDEDQGTPTGAV